MRWMVIAFVVALALIVDQLRFSGHYRKTTTDMARNAIVRLTR